ncbi:Lipopolysaccharide cholinephosphotransferase LicD1 [Anaerovibrio sp. JC8]|uniref:LicD family protein n=1 Tax=Anaerovibrio sp. JC8 TaxID=1240085 RepID=UPI000A09C929|nr:LicD family protein [Anaerovibrio sp. JC8]ORU01446.1 Lipopolysaccharide cholinephosphotransferase LicD1 [Anaerovibrio sp. JC8]
MQELTIRETQEVALEVLKTITDLCEKIGSRYFLAYGTLLGAVRHKGFIPWDDDVDIMMPRPDYERLLSYFKEHAEEYPHIRLFNYDECPEYPYMISRFSDNRYKLVVDNEKPYGMGVFIDVYPLDGLGNDYKLAVKKAKKADFLSTCCFQATRQHYSTEINTSGHKILKNILKIPVFIFSKIMGKDYFQRKLKCIKYEEYEASDYVGCGVWIVGGEEDVFPRSMFTELMDSNFENYSFKIPKEYDAVLKKIFNDYMKLPPEKDRVGHHHYRTYRL